MKKVILVVVITLTVIAGYSQKEDTGFDQKFRFGYNIGLNCSNLQSVDEMPENAEISNGVGFNLGLLMDYKITNRVLFSPKVGLSFNDSKVIFNEQDDYKVFPISLEIMTHMVYRFGDGNTRPYLLVGPNFRCPIPDDVKSKTNFSSAPDLAIDFGVGIDKALPYFIFATELRYSYGLLNVNGNPAIKSLNFHNVTLAFNFKG
jgi:hypothetical protein